MEERGSWNASDADDDADGEEVGIEKANVEGDDDEEEGIEEDDTDIDPDADDDDDKLQEDIETVLKLFHLSNLPFAAVKPHTCAPLLS